MYSLYRSKETTKKEYKNIMNSIKLWNKMDTTFMNSDNSKRSDPHRILLNLTDKINVALSDLSVYYTWRNVKKSYKNNKFKISTLTQNKEFELPDGLYSVSDIQDYFKCILKTYQTVTDNPSIIIYVNKKKIELRFK